MGCGYPLTYNLQVLTEIVPSFILNNSSFSGWGYVSIGNNHSHMMSGEGQSANRITTCVPFKVNPGIHVGYSLLAGQHSITEP